MGNIFASKDEGKQGTGCEVKQRVFDRLIVQFPGSVVRCQPT